LASTTITENLEFFCLHKIRSVLSFVERNKDVEEEVHLYHKQLCLLLAITVRCKPRDGYSQ